MEDDDLYLSDNEAIMPILPAGRDEPWDIHSLLADDGIRSPLLSIVEVRRLVLQEKSHFLNISRSDKGMYLRDTGLHNQLVLENPFVEVAVRSMLYEAACDEPVLPKWNVYKKSVNSYVAFLCALTIIGSEEPLAQLPRFATMADRSHIIISTARAIFEAAAEDLPYWRHVAYRQSFAPNAFSFAPPFPVIAPPRTQRVAPRFPDWDLED